VDGLEPHPVPAAVESGVASWTLNVTGSVEHPLSLTRADLRAFPLERYTADFECVAGWSAAGLQWRGVGVREMLDRAGATDDAEYALVRAMDGDYACLFALDRVADAVLAVELDGEPLPVDHGGPARLVPTDGSDCWESVKWVAELELLASEPDDGDTAKELALSRIESG
jgi:DMSO/TMAO reductase YedYZ molybdopterin-dependent catalytic subunit